MQPCWADESSFSVFSTVHAFVFYLTPASSALRMASSCSVNSGSTLECMETSWPRASAARSLTARLESCRAFRKVVWSCGRKGFRAMPTCTREGGVMSVNEGSSSSWGQRRDGHWLWPAAEWASPAEPSSQTKRSGLLGYGWAVQWCWPQRAAAPPLMSA